MMTTYFIYGNAKGLHHMLEGIEDAPEDESFVIFTKGTFPKSNKDLIHRLCSVNDRIKVIYRKSSKRTFPTFIREHYQKYMSDPETSLVIIPNTLVKDVGFKQYLAERRILIQNSYASCDTKAGHIATKAFDWKNVALPDTETGGKMHILIDYENVNNTGLEGSQYLSQEDNVLLFYSGICVNTQQGHFNNMTQKTESFEMIKLKQKRKNGIDFYIAIKVGEIIKEHPEDKILIVSKDQGYLAIYDYCQEYVGMKDRIRGEESIETGIVMLDGDTKRRKQILDSRVSVNIETEYALYKERNAMYEQIAELLSDTPYMDDIEQIFGIMKYAATPKDTYTATLHAFGLKRGRKIYRIMKRVEVA